MVDVPVRVLGVVADRVVAECHGGRVGAISVERDVACRFGIREDRGQDQGQGHREVALPLDLVPVGLVAPRGRGGCDEQFLEAIAGADLVEGGRLLASFDDDDEIPGLLREILAHEVGALRVVDDRVRQALRGFVEASGLDLDEVPRNLAFCDAD